MLQLSSGRKLFSELKFVADNLPSTYNVMWCSDSNECSLDPSISIISELTTWVGPGCFHQISNSLLCWNSH